MNFLIILFVVTIIISIGLLVLNILLKTDKISIIERLGYAWGLGVGVLGLQLFIYSLTGINWNIIAILVPWILIFIFTLFKGNFVIITGIKLYITKLDKILIILLILLNLFVGFESVLRPVQAWDGWDNWILRPKIFYLNNNIDLDYVTYTNDDYPLIMPLMSTFGYIMLGEIDDRNILFLHYIFYLSLCLLFFSAAKKYMSTTLALLFTFLLMSTQNIIRHGGRYEAGQSDLAIGYYIFAGTLLLINFIATKEKKYLFILSIFLGIIGQIKNDGMAYFLYMHIIILIILYLWKKYKYVLYLLPSILISTIWILYKSINNYPTNFLFRSELNIHFDKFLDILLSMSKEFMNIQNWNILWIVFIVSIILYFKKLKITKIILLIIILQWISYFAIFLITPREPVGHIENIIDKLYLHIAPLAVLVIGIIISNVISKTKMPLKTRKINNIKLK